jgi:hypothetical protein
LPTSAFAANLADDWNEYIFRSHGGDWWEETAILRDSRLDEPMVRPLISRMARDGNWRHAVRPSGIGVSLKYVYSGTPTER